MKNHITSDCAIKLKYICKEINEKIVQIISSILVRKILIFLCN